MGCTSSNPEKSVAENTNAKKQSPPSVGSQAAVAAPKPTPTSSQGGRSETKIQNNSPRDVDASVAKIQKWARRVNSMKLAKKEQRWKIFSDLDTIEEAEMLQLSTFLRLVLKEVAIQNPAIEIDEISAETPETPETSETSGASLDDIKVEGIGSSVHSKIRDQAPILLAKQIDLATATEVIEVFRYGGTLHKDSVMNILRKAYAKLKAAPNVVNVSLPAQGKLTVVGDIHGQLADLLHILDECGLPSPTNKYIFNGDFVDRGPNGVEVVCILFALYIAEPDNVTLVRGNHEDILITKVYGFQDECVSKYDSLVFGMFTEVFKYLPLFSLVDNSIFVVHGGLFNNRQVKISDLEKIARFDYVAKPEIPYPKCNEGLDADGQWAEYYKQLQRDALWSDPMIEDGLRDNPRGAGVFFGPNIAQAFMDLNRVSMIIRAHECVNTGFFLPYAQTANPANLTANTPLLCTLFSASNYGGAGNDGAYLVVMAHSHTNSFAVGSTGLHYSVHNFNCSSDSSGNALETASTSSLSELIVKKKAALRVAFEAKDVEGTGWVTRLQWSEVMQQVTTIRIRWLSLLSDLASSKCLTSTHVDYRKFLSSFRVQSKRIPQSASNVPAPAVMDALYGQRKKLEAVFNYFDVNGDGLITHEEFEKGCALLNEHLPTDQRLEDVRHFMDLMDFDGSGSIDINEFFETFRILDSKELGGN